MRVLYSNVGNGVTRRKKILEYLQSVKTAFSVVFIAEQVKKDVTLEPLYKNYVTTLDALPNNRGLAAYYDPTIPGCPETFSVDNEFDIITGSLNVERKNGTKQRHVIGTYRNHSDDTTTYLNKLKGD